jgi:hypothetical protein
MKDVKKQDGVESFGEKTKRNECGEGRGRIVLEDEQIKTIPGVDVWDGLSPAQKTLTRFQTLSRFLSSVAKAGSSGIGTL